MNFVLQILAFIQYSKMDLVLMMWGANVQTGIMRQRVLRSFVLLCYVDAPVPFLYICLFQILKKPV
jgi:hypothetical protein